ncbi:MAG: hypothetical protein U0Q15_11415 [Kineosporiaceae bacterium]
MTQQDPQGRPVEETGRPRAVAQAVGARLAAAGWQVSDAAWPDRTVTTGRTSKWMWQAGFSKIHTAVVLVPLRGDEDRTWLDGLQRHVVNFSMATQPGLPPGLQSGSAVLTVAVGENVAEHLTEWARKARGRQFGVMTHPVLVDAATGQVTHPRGAIIGAALNGHFKRVVTQLIQPAVTSA